MSNTSEELQSYLYDAEWELESLLSPNERVICIDNLEELINSIGHKIDQVKYYSYKLSLEDLEQIHTDLKFIKMGARP